MNDLVELKDAWGEPTPPSQTAYSAARTALLRQIDAVGTTGPARKRPNWRFGRLGWLVGSTAVTAALAVGVAFAFAPGTAPPERSPNEGLGASTDASTGRQILLAAATVAERQPAGAGTYWYVKSLLDLSDDGPQTMETWLTRDGKDYILAKDLGGVLLVTPFGAIDAGGRALTMEQLQQLPTDPTALKEWIADSYAHPSGPDPNPGGPELPRPTYADGDRTRIADAALPGVIVEALVKLLAKMPAPPAVRAAAFRAIAAMPNVTSLGERDGGQALRVTFPPPAADKYPGGKLPAGAGEMTLVIDPETATLVSSTNSQGTIKVLAAEWTDDMPKIVTAPPK